MYTQSCSIASPNRKSCGRTLSNMHASEFYNNNTPVGNPCGEETGQTLAQSQLFSLARVYHPWGMIFFLFLEELGSQVGVKDGLLICVSLLWKGTWRVGKMLD